MKYDDKVYKLYQRQYGAEWKSTMEDMGRLRISQQDPPRHFLQQIKGDPGCK